MSPSQDIATTLAQIERFHHQASGGWWKDQNGEWICAGANIKTFFCQTHGFRSILDTGMTWRLPSLLVLYGNSNAHRFLFYFQGQLNFLHGIRRHHFHGRPQLACLMTMSLGFCLHTSVYYILRAPPGSDANTSSQELQTSVRKDPGFSFTVEGRYVHFVSHCWQHS